MLKEQKLISYLVVREKVSTGYLSKFNIAKDDFNSLPVSNNAELRRYYDEEYKRALTKVMDDEYVGITFDNLDAIKEALEEKIEKAEADVIAAKKKYDQATANLKELLDKRDAIRKEEILSAVVKSGRSYEEIMNFLNAGSDGEKTEK